VLCGDDWSGMGIKVWHGSVRSNAVRLGRARHGSGFRARYGPVCLGGLWQVRAGQGICGRVRSGSVRCGEPWLRMVW
jgi:hypothetical protein